MRDGKTIAGRGGKATINCVRKEGSELAAETLQKNKMGRIQALLARGEKVKAGSCAKDECRRPSTHCFQVQNHDPAGRSSQKEECRDEAGKVRPGSSEHLISTCILRDGAKKKRGERFLFGRKNRGGKKKSGSPLVLKRGDIS